MTGSAVQVWLRCRHCRNRAAYISANNLAVTSCVCYSVARPEICLDGSCLKSVSENSHFRNVFMMSVSSVSSISLSVSELQRAAVLLSTSQIIQASLCYCWWSINQLLFHSSGGLCLNTHLLRVHSTSWVFLWMAEPRLGFYIHS